MSEEEKKDGKFMDLFEIDAGDKHTGREFIELVKLLPKTVTKQIPLCITSDRGEWNYEVIGLMAWIRAKRDLPGISKESADNLLTDIRNKLNGNNVTKIAMELIYFWGDSTRDEIQARVERVPDTIEIPKEQPEPEVEASTENPTE